MRPEGAALAGEDFMGTFGFTRIATVAGGLALALAAAVPAAARPVAAPPANAFLYAVGCHSATDCEAVGYYALKSSPQDYSPLAEGWNGHSWQVQHVPAPAGATVTRLAGVACPAAKTCFAAGEIFRGVQTAPVLERWNGSTWSVQKFTTPSGAIDGELLAISCASVSFCVAVGDIIKGADSVPLLAGWNGQAWTGKVVTTGFTQSFLMGVACPATRTCVAAGEVLHGTNSYETYAGHWNGSSWTGRALSPPSGTLSSKLDSVACSAVGHCLAAGYAITATGQDTIADTLTGSAWKLSPPKNPSAQSKPWNTVNGASCPANGVCVAVGAIAASTGTVTLAEEWTGGRWKVLTTLNVAHDVGTILGGVACVSKTYCVAVGYSQSSPDNTGYSVLAERFNGTHWLMIAPKQP